MEDSFFFEHSGGDKGVVRQHDIPLPLLHQMNWCLEKMGKPFKMTSALLKSIKKNSANGVLKTGFFQRYDRSGKAGGATAMAKNWAAMLGNKNPSPEWMLGAKVRFGDYVNRGVAITQHCAPSAEEKVFIDMGAVSFTAPTATSEDIQKVFLAPPEKVGEFDKLLTALQELEAAYTAASAEWKEAGLSPGSKINPFSKPVSILRGGKWQRHQTGMSLAGTFWVAVGFDAAGPLFISPNGSRMREISRGKMFNTQEEAMCWAQGYGGTGAMSLEWSAASCVPAPGKRSTGLEAIFAFKEREDIAAGMADGVGQAPLAPAKSTRRSL